MSISYHNFKSILMSLQDADEHAQVRDLDIYEYPEYLEIVVTWYDYSQQSYKFYLSEEESYNAIQWAFECNYKIHTWSEIAQKAIDDAEYHYFED